MNFQSNIAGLDNLLSQFAAFIGTDNPGSRFAPIRVSIDNFKKSPDLTKEQLGDEALDEVSGVACGSPTTGAITLYTGNTPGSAQRAAFLADMLTNFPVFHAWMRAYIDTRESGFIVSRNSETGEFLAIGPGFQSLEESPHAVHATPEGAFQGLLAQLEAQAKTEAAEIIG